MVEQAEPTGGTRRSRRREARKNEMLDAAMNIVIHQGIDALTIGRLAGDIDAAVGALYRYFPGKEALVVSLQERAITAFGASMKSDVRRARASIASETWERSEVLALVPVIAALRSYPRFHDAEPALYALIDSSLSDPRALLTDDDHHTIDDVLTPVLGVAAELIDAATDAGALDSGDGMVRTHIAWGALHGLGHFRKRDHRSPHELSTHRLIEQTLRTLLRGWGADRELLTAAFRRL